VIVILVAVLAHDDQAADPTMGQQRFVDRQIGEILLDGDALVLVERDAGFHRVESRRRVAGVVGERIWRQSGWKMVTHNTTVTDDRTPVEQGVHRSIDPGGR
jgi:hypothetical protein